ncbi:hypothetical protein B0H13DRAFT_2329795 [Mycena leptocephala]|nr:hypothetical protein B0H13DRAFT_2329795 [Mycena leptocephala]
MVIEPDRPKAPACLQQLSLPEGVYAWFIIFRQTHGDDEAGLEPEVIYTWSLFFRNTRGGDNAGLNQRLSTPGPSSSAGSWLGHQWRSPTPPSSPRPLHDLLALTQQLTPSKSPRAVCRIRQQIQAQANEAQQEQANLKRRAVDAEHQVDTSRKPRKMRKRNDRARDADDSELNPQDTETRIRDAGRHFALTEAIFLIDDDIMDTVADASFDFAEEFDSSKNERQCQLRDILAILPDDVRPKVNKRWVQDSFLDGLHNQRSSMGYRVRTEALQYIVDDVKLFATSASRFGAFSELIGYKPATKTSQAFYERFEVPLLYGKWDGTINVNGLFRGNAALEVYVSCIRGRQGANGLFDGKSKLPQAKCLERIHKITLHSLKL